MFTTRPRTRRDERGQILVIFALAATAIIAMVGLVLDGSGAYAQRRTEQNAADLAALAGANAYMNTNSTNRTVRRDAAYAAATASYAQNGYTNGVDSAAIDMTITYESSGATIKVGLIDAHENSFARIVPGQGSWNVAVTASAWAGVIDTGVGAAPWTMHIDAFNADGTPKYTVSNPINFGTGCGDYPTSGTDMSWTDFNGADNVNSSEVKNILDGSEIVTATFGFGQYLGQHNNGCHTTLWDNTQASLAGKNVPIPIVGPPTAPATTCTGSTYDGGCFKGWAMFHVISASGGTDKVINGYFLENFRTKPLTVGECTPVQEAAGTCGLIITTSPFDNYTVKLTD
jgi:Flp pilus assembly protein TadG